MAKRVWLAALLLVLPVGCHARRGGNPIFRLSAETGIALSTIVAPGEVQVITVDEFTGSAVPDARIISQEPTTDVRTDKDGIARFRVDRDGPLTLAVSRVGYEDWTGSIPAYVGAGRVLVIRLKQLRLRLQSVVGTC